MAIRADFGDLSGEFVTENTRVAEERLIALEGVQIGPADADPPDSDERLAIRPRRWRGVTRYEFTRFL